MQIEPTCRDLIDKLIVLDPDQRLGAAGTGGMDALKRHPFFQGVNFSGDMRILGLKRALRETESQELRQRRIDEAPDTTLPKFRYALVEPGKPILTGLLLKKNRFWIKQERRFELYMEGFIRYFENTKVKGEMKLTPGAKAVHLSRTEVEITLPENKKNYLLVQQDLSKCPAKSQYFSCGLNDWVDAINYVLETINEESAF
uniref:Uncharacterized protein n=1 Tax=Favella ehrenbergii TaxID=182087 RepID=A0A7S3HVN4_9SPIT|mmetsp:Transcript_11349/g.14296  ORF Transcript_11349/g.14296 Transcript_11349/m.14296 type:complete len:201 (+) Transcript_11349:947-1549(+)